MLRNYFVLASRGISRWKKMPDLKYNKKFDSLKLLVKNLSKTQTTLKSLSINSFVIQNQYSKAKKYHLFADSEKYWMVRLSNSIK